MREGWENFDWIAPDLAVGGSFGCQHVEAVARAHGVGAVIDLRDEACDDPQLMQLHGIAFLHLPTPDNRAISQTDLDRGVAFARAAAEREQWLMVHCQHGIGRSALLALCIMVDRGDGPMEALRQMKAARPCVSPSPEQYRGWADWLTGRGVAAPPFDAFAEVAYSHLRAAG